MRYAVYYLLANSVLNAVIKNNTLVSSDNKGMAAYLYESYIEPNSVPGNTTFVAGFAQSNVGDTSPNTSVIWLSCIRRGSYLLTALARSAKVPERLGTAWLASSTTRRVAVP